MLKKHKSEQKKYKLAMGILLIIIGFSLLISNYVNKKIDYAYEYMNNKLFMAENNTEIEEEVEVDVIEVENIPAEEVDEKSLTSNEYIGRLEIPKINLKRGFVGLNSNLNNVEKNIAIMEGSSFPDIDKGNFIIAAHSGPAWNSFFNDLYILANGDIANVYYKNTKYSYKLVNFYKVEKNGKVSIKRNKNKTTLTLITCTNGSKNQQSVYIFELDNKNSY